MHGHSHHSATRGTGFSATSRPFPSPKALMLHGERLAASCRHPDQLAVNRQYILEMATRGVERSHYSEEEVSRIHNYIDALTRHHTQRLNRRTSF